MYVLGIPIARGRSTFTGRLIGWIDSRLVDVPDDKFVSNLDATLIRLTEAARRRV
jgi:hypothetical protein